MKYLRKFNNESEKNAWRASEEHVIPNVVLVEREVRYNVEVDQSKLPFYIEATEDITISFNYNGYTYSKDKNTWVSGKSTTSISANAGEKVYFRAGGAVASYGIGTFAVTNGKCNVGGNIMSLIYGAEFDGKITIATNTQFQNLFSNCVNLVDASKLILPATTLANSCYSSMFYKCTSLISAPELPATTLVKSCYSQMFRGCTSLISAPELPAITLAESCYNFMFNDCTSLISASELPATTLERNCYQGMFYGCTNLSYIKAMFTTTPSSSYTSDWLYDVAASGTFVKNAAATWNVTGVNGIPEGWTVETAEA